MIQIKYNSRTSALRVMIYNQARQLVTKGFENDGDEVKAIRDSYCNEMFGKHYTLLNDYQMQRVFDEMVRDSKQLNSAPQKVASKVQIARVRFLAVWYAVEYCELNGMVEHSNGIDYKGEDLRKFLKQMLDKNLLMKLTHFTVNELFLRQCNPKCHGLLIEGGFKKKTLNPQKFYYQSMKPDEASYLVQRFEQMRTQKEMTTVKFAQNSADEYLQSTGRALN